MNARYIVEYMDTELEVHETTVRAFDAQNALDTFERRFPNYVTTGWTKLVEPVEKVDPVEALRALAAEYEWDADNEGRAKSWGMVRAALAKVPA